MMNAKLIGKRLAHARGMTYVTTIPRVLPAGSVLVHNVLPQSPNQQPDGAWGFRAWLASPDVPRLKRCACGWAPTLGEHFSTRFARA
jgi:hypothetical protein